MFKNKSISKPMPRRSLRLTKSIALILIMTALGACLRFLTANPSQREQLLKNVPNVSNLTPPIALSHPINILVLGIDNSGHPHTSANYSPAEALSGNSDTMLMVRLLPEEHQVNVLSIPRDTLVQLPEGIGKINDANAKGGASFAKQTVSQLLGNLPIDRYIRVDTEGFIQLVDALGGVEVTIPKPMNYDDQTQNLHIHFEAGRQTLTGQHLEEFVRFRHDDLGDIGRVQRQQMALKSIQSKFWHPETALKLPQLLQVFQKNLDSDLSTNELLGIGYFLSQVERKNINLVMLPGRFSTYNEYPLSYWISDPQAITPILSRYFETQPLLDTSVSAATSIDTSQVKVAVANGTNESGLAARVVQSLRGRGFSGAYVVYQQMDVMADSKGETQIIAQKGNTEQAEAVKNAIGLGQVQVASTGDLQSDITVVVGQDIQSRAKN